jgi:hypothetical protein
VRCYHIHVVTGHGVRAQDVWDGGFATHLSGGLGTAALPPVASATSLGAGHPHQTDPCEKAPNLNPTSNWFYLADLAAQIGAIQETANGTRHDLAGRAESVAESDA